MLEIWNLVQDFSELRAPRAVATERSEAATKGLRVYKIRRLRGACV